LSIYRKTIGLFGKEKMRENKKKKSKKKFWLILSENFQKEIFVEKEGRRKEVLNGER